LGDLASDFDFTQAPCTPLVLPLQPQTTLIPPSKAPTPSGALADPED